MIIVLLEILVIILLINNKVLIQQYRKIWYIVFIVIIWLLLWLILLHLELVFISFDGSYGSDERYYYVNICRTFYHGEFWPQKGTLAPAYVAFGAIILHTSPIISIVWVRLGNIGLMLISLVLSFYILRFWKVSKNITYFVILLIGTNGVITWTSIRGLKEMMFICISLKLIIVMQILLSKKYNIPILLRVFCVLLIGTFMAWIMKLLRPWGVYWTITIILAVIIEFIFRNNVPIQFMLHRSFKIRIWLLWLVIILFVVPQFVLGYEKLIYERLINDFAILEDFSDQWTKGIERERNLVFDIARFLVGPGPIRAIMGWEFFKVTTTIGNILIALGTIIWWMYLPVLILFFTQKPKCWLKYASISVPLFAFTLLYAYTYAGSPDTRSRAIVYWLSFLGTAPYLDKVTKCKDKKKFIITYNLIVSVIWFLGTLLSFK